MRARSLTSSSLSLSLYCCPHPSLQPRLSTDSSQSLIPVSLMSRFYLISAQPPLLSGELRRCVSSVVRVWYFHLRAHCLRNGDEHPASEVWPFLPVLIAVFERCFRSEVWIGSTCLNSDGWWSDQLFQPVITTSDWSKSQGLVVHIFLQLFCVERTRTNN